MSALAVGGSALLAGAFSPALLALADATTHRPTPATGAKRAGIGGLLAAVGALVGWRLGALGALTLLPVLVLGGAAALVDLRERRLPDRLTGSLAAATLAAVAVAVAVAPPPAARAFCGAAIGLGLALIGRLAAPGAIGWGDVKLVPSLTAWLAGASWATLYVGLLGWSVLIAATAAVVVLRDQRGGTVVPYGPAMVLGTVIPIAVTG